MIGRAAHRPRRASGDNGFDSRRMTSLPVNSIRRAVRFPRSVALRSKGLLLISLFCLAGVMLPFPLGAADIGVPKPKARDKCPVCGMFVANHPEWLAAIRFPNGSHVFFDGVKDLFKYLQEPKRYDSRRKPEDIRAVLVMDYYDLSWIDAQEAWFVIGSDVYGPMGRELIPLKNEADANEFMKDHGGLKIIRFPEVTREVIKTLD